MVLPIIQGPLKGKKWIAGSFNHGCWLGTYEYDKQLKFTQYIKHGDCVYDIGAHVGFYTLLSSVLVGETGFVYSFEPFPRNQEYLQKHVELNNLQNVMPYGNAVGNTENTVYFEVHETSSMGKVGDKGNLQVAQIKLDTFVNTQNLQMPDVMKIDVEGAEYDVLIGAKQLLMQSHPIIFLATHGQEVHKQCIEFLQEIGYQLEPVGGSDIFATDELIAYI